MDELLPGDLLFHLDDTNTPNHVGIVAGTDKHGNQLVVHCGRNGVQVIRLDANTLNVPRRPLLLTGEYLEEFHHRMELRAGRPAMRDYLAILAARE